MKLFLYLLRFIWELPQNILGVIVWLFVNRKITKTEFQNKRFFFHTPNFGISLGSFIFWSNSDNAIILINHDNIQHEFGHSIQSFFFGPLYLLVIGLPSISRVIYGSIYFIIYKKQWQNYYKGFPEKWADTLGAKHYKV